MESVVLLNSNENTKQFEQEERVRFVRGTLDMLGLPLEGIWDGEGALSIENRIKLRQILATYNIEIIENIEGELQIYHENTLIGRWDKCKYTLKKDNSQRDPRKRLYLECKLNFWSIFEENNA